MIAVAAMLATSSAINATFYGCGRLTYLIAKSGELPRELERNIHGQPLEGMGVFAILTLLIANFVPLNAIATMGSAGFLLIFMAVNFSNVRLAKQTKSRTWISWLACLACAFALIVLCFETAENPVSRWHLAILAGMVGGAWAIEVLYRSLTGVRFNCHVDAMSTSHHNPKTNGLARSR